MSDVGLDVSIYEQLRSYADKLDCALVNLRSGSSDTVVKTRGELASLLREIGSEGTVNPSSRLVAFILKEELKSSPQDLSRAIRSLAESLEKNAPGKDELERLERIALAIDKECASVGARIRGRS